MQHFDIAVRERIILRLLKMEEVGYYYRINGFELTPDKRAEKVESLCKKVKDKSRWIIVLQLDNGKVFGIMEVEEISEGKAKASIEIPNETPRIIKDGKDAVDQFVKVCMQRKYFSEIVFSDNSIMNEYCRIHQINDNKIVIK